MRNKARTNLYNKKAKTISKSAIKQINNKRKAEKSNFFTNRKIKSSKGTFYKRVYT